MFFKGKKFGTGAIEDPRDHRDRVFDGVAFGAPLFDWNKGYDIEKELNIKIPIKNQDGSSSCVGQGWSYYTGVVNSKEIGHYKELSAKAYYSQIHLSNGGAYIRDGGRLTVNWGAVGETIVPSYKNGKPPDEAFMQDNSWKSDDIDQLAKVLEAKEYRTIVACDNMDLFAIAIRDNLGVVGGVAGSNNKTWYSNEPKPPKSLNDIEWRHCLFFGKAGSDKLGRYIATPNSWGERKKDNLHPDGWQKLREDYFNKNYMFNPWTLVDKSNNMDPEIRKLIDENRGKIIVEGEKPGRKGIIIGDELREIVRQPNEERISVAEGCLWVLTNNGFGKTVTKDTFDRLPKGNNF